LSNILWKLDNVTPFRARSGGLNGKRLSVSLLLEPVPDEAILRLRVVATLNVGLDVGTVRSRIM
jgi:hypothetical protein